MADDLDRLLDEVEERLCRLPGPGTAGRQRHGGGEAEEGATAAKEGRSAKLLMSAGSSEEDIDDIIDEICSDSSFTKTPLKLKSNSASLTPESNSAVIQAYRKRCCPVYLGGSSSPNGIGTNISKRTCDRLRCTACDFHVSLFNDYIWDQSCDYLFFSHFNNHPVVTVPDEKFNSVVVPIVHRDFYTLSLDNDPGSLNPTENMAYKNIDLQLI